MQVLCLLPIPEGRWNASVVALAMLLLVAELCAVAPAQTKPGGEAQKKGENAEVARGKYIVEDVAVCSQCHTPRDDAGNLDHSRWLEGAAVWLKPAQPTADWPLQAPRLAGTLPASDADMVKLLTTGIWQNGRRLRPPMPVFHMSRADAMAAIAYLRSLAPSAH
jgi:hypothetical protein